MEYGKAKLNLMRNFCTAMMNLHYKSPLLLVFLWTEFQFTENNSHIFSIKMQFSTENKTKMKLDIRSRKDKSFLAGDIKRQTSVVKCAGRLSVGYQFRVTSSQRDAILICIGSTIYGHSV